ncbi:ankyrin repeat and SOCS box protein 13-like isoform X2 [Phycodurus eques]|uniref:ankyrin repeat and SOCS box protein 13-like isoform X2 n=1 Tax=Phycodurus eques TaxID=693459 RepID=UPI002ACDA82C|nr:ankyrin repeat and SOCS box protein 13-like isoform X2 [Phycodurus eques]
MEITTRHRASLYGDIAHGLGFWAERSAVHEAAARGRAAQLQQLIRDGAAVDAAAGDSIAPLHEACVQGHARCVALLLAAGAQVDARNIDGSTPLCDACAAGSPECVELLLDYGAAVNPPLCMSSPLHEACVRGSSACVSLLMERGARMEARDCCYGTPLHVACACQHYDCTKLLLNAGANVNAAKLHETALHHAAKTRRVDLIELLLEFGADPHARDLAGKKAVQYTAPGSPAHGCFRFYEDTPLSLQQMTRVALRRILGVRALRVFSQLGLPNRMIAFLSYSPPPVFDV